MTRRALLALVLLWCAACGGGGAGGGDDRRAADDGERAPAGDPARDLELDLRWTWAAPSTGMPASDGREVAIVSTRSKITLLDGGGAVRWELEGRSLRDVAPTLTPDLVLVPTEDGLLAVDRAGGRRRWEAAVGERVNTPAVVGTRAVATTWEGTLVAFELADGRIAWRTPLGGASLGPAVAAGSGTAVATFDSGRAAGAVATDVATGRPRWTVPLPANGVSGPAVEGDTVVLVAGDISAHGLALADGSTRWRQRLQGSGSPEVPPLPRGDGTVLVGHRQGGVALLDARDGAVRWDASAPDSAAVRGGPVGPGPNGWFALPLDDGQVLMAGPDREPDVRDPPGFVPGVAAGPGGVLLIARTQGDDNGLDAVSGW
ncbi:MAG: PQQ-binding-like beta-propeller repeat protein [Acidimicrobiia bacterium]